MGILDKIISAKMDRVNIQKKTLSIESLMKKKSDSNKYYPLEDILNSRNIKYLNKIYLLNDYLMEYIALSSSY